jgi:antitoxin ParD1/3/4
MDEGKGMKAATVQIAEKQSEFVERQITEGRFGSLSEAVRAALELLEEQELKIERLRRSLEEGEASGEPEPFDMDIYIAEKRRATL